MIVVPGIDNVVSILKEKFKRGSLELDILSKMDLSQSKYNYSSQGELEFEIEMRNNIVAAAQELYKSKMAFAVFRETTANPKFWGIMRNGGFELKNGVSAFDAINDIFENSKMYGTECATAMVIVYYRAISKMVSKELFDKAFKNIKLMNWHYIDAKLSEIGSMVKTKDYLPGDRRYFKNPEVNLETPEWQGENVIDLNNGLYYGHGMGVFPAEIIVKSLNQNRRSGATKTAYLMDTAGNPNYKALYRLFNSRND